MALKINKRYLSMSFTSIKKIGFVYLTLMLVVVGGCYADQTKEQALLEGAFKQEKQYRASVTAELQRLKTHLPKEVSANLKDRVMKRITQDILAMTQLNDVIKPYSAEDYPKFEEGEVTWSLKTNKVIVLLEGASKIIENEFEDLVNGSLIDELISRLKTTPVMGPYDSEKRNFYGNPQASFVYTALLLVLIENGVELTDLNVDTSVIFHTTPLPLKDFNLKDIPAFTQSSWFYSDDKSPATGELFLVHGGYLFGGMRGESRYGNEAKTCGPQDCSSWTRWLIKAEDFSTDHQLFHWRSKFGGFIPEDWEGSKEQVSLAEKLEPVDVKTFADIKPGFIYTHRGFKVEEDPTMTKTKGRGGHVGIVTAVNAERGTVTILNYARSLPDTDFDGFGLMDFPVFNVDGKKVFFFKPKK